MNNINQLIDQIAANVFWNSVKKTNFKNTSELILKKNFRRIWGLVDLEKHLQNLAFQTGKLDRDQLLSLYKMVNNYMHECEERMININGTYYVEDIANCRPPDFDQNETLEKLAFDNLSNYNDMKVKIINSVEEKYVVMGKLMLRSPLPAAVLISVTENFPRLIKVKDTYTSLGFQKSIFLLAPSFDRIPLDNLKYNFFASGVFIIPTKDGFQHLWRQIIPNAIFFTNDGSQKDDSMRFARVLYEKQFNMKEDKQ